MQPKTRYRFVGKPDFHRIINENPEASGIAVTCGKNWVVLFRVADGEYGRRLFESGIRYDSYPFAHRTQADGGSLLSIDVMPTCDRLPRPWVAVLVGTFAEVQPLIETIRRLAKVETKTNVLVY